MAQDEHRDRIIILEQQVSQLLPIARDTSDQVGKLAEAVVRLAEQGERQKELSATVREVQMEIRSIMSHQAVHARRIDSLEESHRAIMEMRDAVMSNKWNTVLLRSAAGAGAAAILAVLVYVIQRLVI